MGKERKKRAAQKAKAAKAAAATQSEDGLIERLVSLMLENWKKLIIPLGPPEGRHEDISELESTLEEQLKKFFEFNQSPDIPDSLNVILKGALGNNRTKNNKLLQRKRVQKNFAEIQRLFSESTHKGETVKAVELILDELET